MMSRDYLLPFLILPSLSLTLLSLYLLIPIQNDGALGRRPTTTSSCGGERRAKLRRAPVMEHSDTSRQACVAERLVR
jgi:hypothetical protein